VRYICPDQRLTVTVREVLAMPVPKAELMRQLRARRRAERLATRGDKSCAVCAKPIPATARADRRTCSTTCRAKLQRRLIGRLRLSSRERRRAFFEICRWLRGPEPWPRLVAAEGVTFSVTNPYGGNHVRIMADDGDEHLCVEISHGGAIYWHVRTTRLEHAFLTLARRMWLPPRDEKIDVRQIADMTAALIG
jgi:hypothetical protein